MHARHERKNRVRYECDLAFQIGSRNSNQIESDHTVATDNYALDNQFISRIEVRFFRAMRELFEKERVSRIRNNTDLRTAILVTFIQFEKKKKQDKFIECLMQL